MADCAGEEYRINARAYLRRCRDRLAEDTKPALFYAAFELRCCIEARLAEYLTHYEPYAKMKVQPFKVGENAKQVQKIMRGDMIVHINASTADGRSTDQYYTPVPQKMKLYVEKHIDRLRHAQRGYREPGDPWWGEVRAGLIDAYRQAWVACRGNLPVPPMWNSTTGEAHPLIVHMDDENPFPRDMFSQGVTFALKVDYLDVPPADWVCDL